MLSNKYFRGLIFLIFCSFYTTAANAQTSGYISVGDSIYTDGYIKFDARKSHEVEYRQTRNADPRIYTADQLSEFGYHDSTKYRSEEVYYQDRSQKQFLKVIADSQLKLYVMLGDKGNLFFLKKDALVQLNKENLLGELTPYVSDCPDILWQLKRVVLTEKSLSYFGSNLKQGKCSPIPFVSYGVVAAANRSTIQLSKDAFFGNTYGDFEMTSENTSAGLFAESPSWVIKNLHFSGQLTYNKMRFSQAHSMSVHEQDVRLNMDLLRLNIQPKYYINLNRFSLFVETGPELLYLLNQSSKLLQATRIESVNGPTKVQLTHTDNFLKTPALQYAITGGSGLMYYVTATHYVSLSINASHSFGKEHAVNNLSTTLRINL